MFRLIIGVFCIILVIGLIWNEIKEQKFKEEDVIIYFIVLSISSLLILWGGSDVISPDRGPSSEWSKLSDSEKEWYERNYGEGGGGRAAAEVLDSLDD